MEYGVQWCLGRWDHCWVLWRCHGPNLVKHWRKVSTWQPQWNAHKCVFVVAVVVVVFFFSWCNECERWSVTVTRHSQITAACWQTALPPTVVTLSRAVCQQSVYMSVKMWANKNKWGARQLPLYIHSWGIPFHVSPRRNTEKHWLSRKMLDAHL